MLSRKPQKQPFIGPAQLAMPAAEAIATKLRTWYDWLEKTSLAPQKTVPYTAKTSTCLVRAQVCVRCSRCKPGTGEEERLRESKSDTARKRREIKSQYSRYPPHVLTVAAVAISSEKMASTSREKNMPGGGWRCRERA